MTENIEAVEESLRLFTSEPVDPSRAYLLVVQRNKELEAENERLRQVVARMTEQMGG